jgi:hypothetical protein
MSNGERKVADVVNRILGSEELMFIAYFLNRGGDTKAGSFSGALSRTDLG